MSHTIPADLPSARRTGTVIYPPGSVLYTLPYRLERNFPERSRLSIARGSLEGDE